MHESEARGWLRGQAANSVTAVRLVLTPPFLWAIGAAYEGASAGIAFALFAVIAVSDFVDGWVARATGTASNAGRVFDHLTDIVFVLSSLLLFAGRRAVPWWVPAAVAASFAVYVADSWRVRRHATAFRLRGSRIGHVGGVVNYVLIGVLLVHEVWRSELLPTEIPITMCWLVLLFSVASVLNRLCVAR